MIVGSGGYDDLVARTEYLDRIHGMDEAVVGRVRDLRDQVQRHRRPAAHREEPDRSRPRRDRRRRAGLGQHPRSVQGRQRRWSRRAAERMAALEKIGEHEEELDGSVAEIQGKIAAELRSTGSAPLPAGPIAGAAGA